MRRFVVALLLVVLLAGLGSAHLTGRKTPPWKKPLKVLAPAQYYDRSSGPFGRRSVPHTIFTFSWVDLSGGALTQQVRDAAEFAGELIARRFSGTAPLIRVYFEMRRFGCAQGACLLGAAGPTAHCTGPSGFVEPSALRRFAGGVCHGSYDIIVQMNADAPFYYGTDGLTPNNRFDFTSVVMHELVHGLGFESRISCSASSCTTYSGTLSKFDSCLRTGAEAFDVQSATAQEIYDWATSGDARINITFPTGAKLYSPGTYRPGSSVSHLDENFNNGANALMTFSLGGGEVTHDIGDVVTDLLEKLGYNMNNCSVGDERPECDIVMVSTGAASSLWGLVKNLF